MNDSATPTIEDANSSLVRVNIAEYISLQIERQMSTFNLDTFEKASMAFQSWSNHFAVMAEVVKRNRGIEFWWDSSIPAPLSEPEFINMTAEDEASIKGAE